MTYIQQQQTANLADDAVTSAKIAAGAVDSAAIATDAVTSAELAADSVGSSEIAAGAVGTSELAADAVTGAEIADDAIGSEHLAANAVDSAAIAANAVKTSEISIDADLDMGGFKLSNLADGVAADDAVTKSQLDAIDPSVRTCVVKTAAYTLTGSDDIIVADSTSGSFTLTMPASPSDGDCWDVSKPVSANQVTVAGNGKNILGNANWVLNNKDSVTLCYCAARTEFLVL